MDTVDLILELTILLGVGTCLYSLLALADQLSKLGKDIRNLDVEIRQVVTEHAYLTKVVGEVRGLIENPSPRRKR